MMIAKGFDNQFVNIEVFVKPNSEIKLMEINPRMFPQALTLYRLCIAHGDPVSTLLDGNLGMRPQAPHLTGKYGVNGYVNTFGNGKAEDLFDFEAASGYKEIQCLFSPGEVVPLSGEEGSNLAFINVCSETEEGAMKKYFTLCRKVVKKPDLSPWDE
uniref:Uncharacterized protein LOC100374822 n=1 Tax=Saccoglossus kowalevskii TaxID=10224 RepID=A0ABM0M389_SACKO|nr:PREDICTED: uncharacterized protein LOC100374822 [Saccoglossus kowalevskii]